MTSKKNKKKYKKSTKKNNKKSPTTNKSRFDVNFPDVKCYTASSSISAPDDLGDYTDNNTTAATVPADNTILETTTETETTKSKPWWKFW